MKKQVEMLLNSRKYVDGIPWACLKHKLNFSTECTLSKEMKPAFVICFAYYI